MPRVVDVPSPLPSCSLTRREEDMRLFRRYLHDRDPRLRAELIERFLPLARMVALRFRRPSQPIDDLFQVASLALVKAVDRFDPERGTAFSTFAVPTISGEIRRSFRDSGWSVRPPRSLLERCLRVERATVTLTERGGRTPTVADLVVHLEDLDEEQILEATYAHRAMDAVSLQEHVAGEDGSAIREERIGEDDDGFEAVDQRVMLDRLMRGIAGRDRDVLQMRFEGDMTQKEIGEVLGISQMQVSRIMRSAIARLRIVAEDDERRAHGRLAGIGAARA